MFTRIASNTSRPFPTLIVDSETFVEEWRACWQEREKPLDKLMLMAEPVFKYWEQLLTNPPANPDVNLISLINLLHHDPIESVNIIEHWLIDEIKDSLIHELQYIFINHVRTAKYFPKFASPKIAEYVIANDYKKRIKQCIASHKKLILYMDQPPIEKLIHIENHPDYYLLDRVYLDKWRSYLLKWINTGKSTSEISKEIKIPRETFYPEEKELWQLLQTEI